MFKGEFLLETIGTLVKKKKKRNKGGVSNTINVTAHLIKKNSVQISFQNFAWVV